MSDERLVTGAELKAMGPAAFEHPALKQPTRELDATANEPLEILMERAARWAALQGSEVVRLPHLFAALLGSGVDARWDWLRKQKPDLESLKQRVLGMVPPQPARIDTDDLPISESVRRVLEQAKQRATRAKRVLLAEDVYHAFWPDSGAVGEQLKKWGVVLPDAALK